MDGATDKSRAGTRIVAASSLLLDQAWPDLGVMAGRERRAASRRVLIDLVRRARESDADVLVVLGDLFDRRCVTPDTIEEIGRAFEAFRGQVLITPGSTDWFSADGPYATADWPDRAHIFRSSTPSPFQLASGIRFWGAAQSSPTPRAPSLPGLSSLVEPMEGCHVALLQADEPTRHDGQESSSMPSSLRSGFGHVIVRRSPWGDGDRDISETGAAVQPILGIVEPSRALLLELDRRGNLVRREALDLGVPALQPSILDATRFQTTSSLLAALAEVDTTLPVQMEGKLPRGVLLPPIAEADRNAPRLLVEALEHELTPPDPDEQTAIAEFERLILEGAGLAQDRHQAIALGLRALDQARRDSDADTGASA